MLCRSDLLCTPNSSFGRPKRAHNEFGVEVLDPQDLINGDGNGTKFQVVVLEATPFQAFELRFHSQ
jgi:hypothetical protein